MRTASGNSEQLGCIQQRQQITKIIYLPKETAMEESNVIASNHSIKESGDKLNGFINDDAFGISSTDSIFPAQETTCQTCSNGATNSLPPNFVYALGRVVPRFPRLSVEKEFQQATGRIDTAGLTERDVLYAVLSERQNRYLLRQICWVFTVEGLDTYILVPRDPGELELLIETVHPNSPLTDVDVVIGAKGPIAPPEVCGGLMIPYVAFDQLYSFDIPTLTREIPKPVSLAALADDKFASTAEEIFVRIMQMTDNAGATDEHRALNYIAVRYPAIYALATDCHGRSFSLTSVDVRPSRLSTNRKITDVIFSFTHRETDVTEKYLTRVDVTEEFPFLVTKMSTYYDR